MEDHRENNNEIELDLLEIVHVLLGRFWIILCAGVIAALAGFVVSAYVLAPVYESTTKIYILNKTDNTAVTYTDVQMGTQLTKDYAELINSRYVIQKVIDLLSLEGIEYEELMKKVSVDAPADTRIVSITVKHTDPALAMSIANGIREVAEEHIQNVMDLEAVNVVETANMPMEKSGPSILKWTLIGGMAGGFLACAAIVIIFLLDDTIKSSEDVEKYLGLSTLAMVPVISEDNTGRKIKRKK
ncbi:MAG: protein-tyrosine kinase [Lachnospiraceae bacterium]|nr:protein-tyrosine kinase [Lachnospiraceae bacterium]MDE7358519.1 protein-tyrosine kinase [Lachnospiraceae bacterium]